MYFLGPKPTLQRTLVSLWVLFVCLLSQLPFRYVWTGRFTFVYDAYTTFSAWNVAKLADLRTGSGAFKLYQDNLPTDLWPSYFFSTLVRQLAAVVQPNTPIAHALVQAIHALLLVPAVGLLFRSLGVPFRYGIIGGLVYGLAGIHVSLSQHVLSHEALLYLVLSLWSLRELILAPHDTPRRSMALWTAFSSLALISLVRVHHEAILYVLPLAAWTAVHLGILHSRDRRLLGPRIAGLAVVGVLVVASSAPMLITAYEMSLTNKTLIHGYDDLGPYFPGLRTFFLALSLRNFTGAAFGAWPGPFRLGEDGTLFYVFTGSLTAALLITVIVAMWTQGRRREALTIVASTILLVGYTIGAGSPIHRLLCWVFPFLVKIGHNYYGLHLLYLIGAFGVASGIHLLAQGRHWRTFVLAQVGIVVAVLYFALRASVQGGPGVSGSLADFGMSLQVDSRWLALCTIAAFACGLVVLLCRRLDPTVQDKAIGLVVLIGLGGIVAVDMLRPTVRAHFVPSGHWVRWEKTPLGGFNASRPIVDFLEQATRGSEERLRVLPIFPKPGGWQSNALLPLNVKLLHMPADSGGNRAISMRLNDTPSPEAVQALADDFGVDAFWVSRWLMEGWSEALSKTPTLQLVKSAEYGGDLYLVEQAAMKRAQYRSSEGWVVPWHDAGKTTRQGLVARKWLFPLSGTDTAGAGPMAVRLPLMWHAAYSVEQAGKRLAFSADDLGRLRVENVDLSAGPLSVQYPGRALSWAVGLSAFIYLALVAVLAALLLLSMAARWGRLRLSPPWLNGSWN